MDKKPEALVIHMLALTELDRPCLDAVSLEEIPLDEGRPDRMVYWAERWRTRHSLVNLLREYWDVVAFGPEEMPSIDPMIMQH